MLGNRICDHGNVFAGGMIARTRAGMIPCLAAIIQGDFYLIDPVVSLIPRAPVVRSHFPQ
jgi:hypothetical protein